MADKRDFAPPSQEAVEDFQKSTEDVIVDLVFGPGMTGVEEVDYIRGGRWDAAPTSGEASDEAKAVLQTLIDYWAGAVGMYSPPGQIQHHIPAARPSSWMPAVEAQRDAGTQAIKASAKEAAISFHTWLGEMLGVSEETEQPEPSNNPKGSDENPGGYDPFKLE